MGESEIQILVSLFNSRFDNVDRNLLATREELQTSRSERDVQMREVRGDISSVKAAVSNVIQNGCAHREAHEAAYKRAQEEVAAAQKELASLRKAVSSANRPVRSVEGRWSEFLGTLDWKNARVTGLSAILAACVVGFILIKYWDSPKTGEVVKHVITTLESPKN